MLLSDRVALITGAASGIGRAAARLFAQEGARVLVADFDEANGLATAEEIKTAGGQALFARTDVSSAADAACAVETAVRAWGRLDILYNNAAPTRLCNERDRAVHELDEAVWDTMIDVALKSVFLMSKHALPVMMRQQRGVILNTSSVDALVAEPGIASYSAAKGGVIALTRSMAVNYAQHGIRVNCISPGYVITECQLDWYENPVARRAAEALHLTRLGRGEDIADVALFLASDKATYITGSNLVIDGGFTAFKHLTAGFYRPEEKPGDPPER